MQSRVCTHKDEKPKRERKLIKGSERKNEHLLLKEEIIEGREGRGEKKDKKKP